MNHEIGWTDNVLREINEKLVISSVRQHELAEKAQRAEQRLSALINELNAVICEISVVSGKMLFLSKRAISFLVYDVARLTKGRFWRRVVHPDDRATVLTQVYEATRLRRNCEQEFRVITADGRAVWVRNHVTLALENGAPELIRCVIVDISRRKQSEAALARSEDRYRRLFEAAQDGILILGKDSGRINHANPVASQLLGLSAPALLGKDLFEAGVFASLEECETAFAELRAEGFLRRDHLPVASFAGEPKRTMQLLSGVYEVSGETLIQCNLRDVTERERMEALQAEALKRERRITEFLQRPLRTTFEEDAFSGLALAALYEPALAEAEVGGDFFDAVVLGERGAEKILLCVGDVAGKGLKAAALAGRIKDVLRAFTGEDPDPAHTLFRLNNYLCAAYHRDAATGNEDQFDLLSLAALSLAVIDPQTGAAVVATAGAEPVAILRMGGYADVVVATGPTLGAEENTVYKKADVHLHPGDTLAMTTDGLTEARRGKQMLDYDGVLDIALRNIATRSVADAGQAIVREARAFGGKFNDDVCLLLARRNTFVITDM